MRGERGGRGGEREREREREREERELAISSIGSTGLSFVSKIISIKPLLFIYTCTSTV